ncbi:DUF4209 domain-containing protein [Shewanella indica]|uniref:DUF4209 domain-containing protein n=1 Tax=Shewanella indica TaxID=768528 RepID=UPI003006EEAD
MSQLHAFTKDDFINSKWRSASKEQSNGYHSLSKGFDELAKEYSEESNEQLSQLMGMFSSMCRMMLEPGSINEPFRPCMVMGGKRTQIPADYSLDDLVFFESILTDIDVPLLQARIADILWLCKRPRNPDFAKIAIESYLKTPITGELWNWVSEKNWERAYNLSRQLRQTESINRIDSVLLDAFFNDYPDFPNLPISIANLLERTGLVRSHAIVVAKRLLEIANQLRDSGNYLHAREHFELAAQLFSAHKTEHEQEWLDCLYNYAYSFEKEADERASQDPPSQMVANSFYANALQAYRSIPRKFREQYGIETKLADIQAQISATGIASVEEMGLISTKKMDLSQAANDAREHVANKGDLFKALLYFSGFRGAKYESLKASAESILNESFISNFFASTTIAPDGRTIGRVPGIDLNGDEDTNAARLHKQILDTFSIEIGIVARASILPALDKLQEEYWVTKDFLEKICRHSPIVPTNREKLMSYALWHGFEYDFGNAIHLLSPQFEHLARMQLKAVGAQTSNIDPNGLENENGLSTLMDLPEALDVFGKDGVFEIKALFTESLCSNLRNEVAHGLLDDDSAYSAASIYAWWSILKLVVRSAAGFPISTEQEQQNSDEE